MWNKGALHALSLKPQANLNAGTALTYRTHNNTSLLLDLNLRITIDT